MQPHPVEGTSHLSKTLECSTANQGLRLQRTTESRIHHVLVVSGEFVTLARCSLSCCAKCARLRLCASMTSSLKGLPTISAAPESNQPDGITAAELASPSILAANTLQCLSLPTLSEPISCYQAGRSSYLRTSDAVMDRQRLAEWRVFGVDPQRTLPC